MMIILWLQCWVLRIHRFWLLSFGRGWNLNLFPFFQSLPLGHFCQNFAVLGTLGTLRLLDNLDHGSLFPNSSGHFMFTGIHAIPNPNHPHPRSQVGWSLQIEQQGRDPSHASALDQSYMPRVASPLGQVALHRKKTVRDSNNDEETSSRRSCQNDSSWFINLEGPL